VPIYWDLDLLHPRVLMPIVRNVWIVERAILLGVNFVFLGMGAAWTVRWVLRKSKGLEIVLLGGWMIVLAASLAQALVEYGENPRYGAPFESLMVLIVILGGWLLAGGARDSLPARGKEHA
jgi:hypothetical protein